MPPDTPPATPHQSPVTPSTAPAIHHQSLYTHLALIAAATAILTAFSAVWTIGYQTSSNTFLHLTDGVIAFGRSAALMPDPGWHFDPHDFAIRWWGHASISRANVWSVSIPLWLPALAAAGATAAIHHRRAKPPATPCHNCLYDLTGLPHTTPCPECGHTPAHSPRML